LKPLQSALRRSQKQYKHFTKYLLINSRFISLHDVDGLKVDERKNESVFALCEVLEPLTN
jgi:hypothetical protein